MSEDDVGIHEDAQGVAPGRRGAGPAGAMETGPHAGAGGGTPEDLDPGVTAAEAERGGDGPRGAQDTGAGDLDEAGA